MTVPVSLDEVCAQVTTMLRVSTNPDQPGAGLLVAATPTVRYLGAALNTSYEVIERAAAAAVDLLIVHHPPWDKVDLHLVAPKLARLSEVGVSLYAAHESLDRVPVLSIADTLARLLGCTVERRCADGSGIIARIPPLRLESFAQRVSRCLRTRVRAWRCARDVRRLAIVPGAGGRTPMLAEAASLGCDTFLTGEGTLFTELFAHETGLSLICATHDATEFPGICAFVERVAAASGIPWRPIHESSHVSGGGIAPIECHAADHRFAARVAEKEEQGVHPRRGSPASKARNA